MSSTGNTLLTGLAAFAGGFLAGVLLAPESGAKTRERIADEAKTQLRRLEGQLEGLETQISNLQRQVRDAGADVGAKVREAAHDAVEAAQEVVEPVPDDPDAFKVDPGEVAQDLRRMPRR